MKYGHPSCSFSVVVEFTGGDSEFHRARGGPDSGISAIDRGRAVERHRGVGLPRRAAGDLRVHVAGARVILVGEQRNGYDYIFEDAW